MKNISPAQRTAASKTNILKQHSPSGAGPDGASITPPNRTGLPDALKSGVESLSGLSLDDVRVHYNSSKPAQFQALAYAQGTDIHVGPGQECHLPHEAWHIVQQKQGRVKPSRQMKQGVLLNDERDLEQEADSMGTKALRQSGDAHPSSLPQNTSVAGTGNNTAQPVQRLIGFEMEYQIPTFGNKVEAVELQGGANTPDVSLKHFLFGGLAYGEELGGSAKLGENSFRLTTDHNNKVSREPIREKLAEMGKLDPADKSDRDASSNLEYVTSPVDELAKGSDKVLGDLIDLVSNHATSTFAIANKGKIDNIPAPSADAYTGTPVDKFRAWLSPEDFEEIKPTIKSFWDNILDSIYIQATIGVMPGGVRTLMEKAADPDGVHFTGDKFSHIYEAIESAATAVGAAVASHKYIQDLKTQKETRTLRSIEGMIRLLVMYLIGEALSQTSAFPGGTIKNAVPFLVKIDPAKISDAGTVGMVLFDMVPDDFVTTLAGEISGLDEITVDYWRTLGYEARVRKKDDFVTAGSVENLTKMFLQGKKPTGTSAQTGSQLKKLDTIKGLKSSDGQQGIPLEYRYVKARPDAAGLKAELMKIVKEAREINLSQGSEEERQKIEKEVKE